MLGGRFFSDMPLHKTGISNTSRGLAPKGWGIHCFLLVPLPYCEDWPWVRCGYLCGVSVVGNTNRVNVDSRLACFSPMQNRLVGPSPIFA